MRRQTSTRQMTKWNVLILQIVRPFIEWPSSDAVGGGFCVVQWLVSCTQRMADVAKQREEYKGQKRKTQERSIAIGICIEWIWFFAWWVISRVQLKYDRPECARFERCDRMEASRFSSNLINRATTRNLSAAWTRSFGLIFRWNAEWKKKSHPIEWSEAHVPRIDAIAICAVERTACSACERLQRAKLYFPIPEINLERYEMKSMAITTNTVRKITRESLSSMFSLSLSLQWDLAMKAKNRIAHEHRVRTK